mgnify:CR=1 FL=1
MFKLSKTIKFKLQKKNFRWDEKLQDYCYETLNESEIHKRIIQYCNLNNITIKSMKIVWSTCTIKIIGNKQDIMNLVLYITEVFQDYIEDLTY